MAAAAAASPPPAVELAGIDKRFGAVHANRAVDLAVGAGTIHGIVGENGAGKSTLMSILYGFYEADSGEIRVDGRPVRIRAPSDAIAAGIGMVHQHFMLVGAMTVLENVTLGAEGGRRLARGAAAARAELAALGAEYGLAVDPDAKVDDLPVGQQQRVEILKALVRGARTLVLDEPTAVLTPDETNRLFAMLRKMAAQGRTILFITHKLREIMALTDRVSVMRRGEMVATYETRDTSPPELADAMVGRKVILKVDKGAARPGAVALEARGLTVRDERGVKRLDDVSFTLRAGEILGVAGVAGNGQSELLEALAGIRPLAGGEIRLNGAALPAAARTPKAMRALSLGHVPEDRHRVGLIMPFEACESAMLGFHDEKIYGAGVLFDRRAIIADAAAKMEAYDIRPRAPLLKTAHFSGGNQQKIVLAREIERNPAVILVGQPTRGVDIGAIEFIHKRIVALRDAGKAVLLVSVELDEIFALADRIVVLCAGRVTGER
ncbi:MAG: ABC transporter ATP-binding protein, partial [Hyphomicrobiales bacterium]|nr:ABC transporter ATP-binding protein [Hyphomicrobiales bacterium]